MFLKSCLFFVLEVVSTDYDHDACDIGADGWAGEGGGVIEMAKVEV